MPSTVEDSHPLTMYGLHIWELPTTKDEKAVTWNLLTGVEMNTLAGT